jgi:hypothetical protein
MKAILKQFLATLAYSGEVQSGFAATSPEQQALLNSL